MTRLMARSTFVPAGALAVLLAAGCGDTRPGTTVEGPDTAPSNTMLDRAGSDARLTTSVQGRFFASDAVKTADIDVDTDDGVVTLEGSVSSEQTRDEAVRLAQSVEGVSRVENRLTIAGTETTAAARAESAADAADERSPAWITTKIQAQYYVNPGLKPWNIDVTTSRAGVVTLTGEVDGQADRAEAVRIARETEGVTDVRDQLRSSAEAATAKGESPAAPAGGADDRTADFDVTEALSDGWVTAKIQSKYFLDPDVKGRNIDVTTNEGIVSLRGTVASEGERRQAASMARSTEGVREVRDELKIDQTVASRSTAGMPRSATQPVDDAWVTTKVRSEFFIDDEIRAAEIDVDTKGGVVTLSGSVESEEARKAAEALARDTDGVSRVVNNLKIAE